VKGNDHPDAVFTDWVRDPEIADSPRAATSTVG
jgi:hypothetical protein